MAQHGGYRRPSQPAPVSGPGALSRRTDGGPTQPMGPLPSGGKYGERKDLQEIRSASPMAGNPQQQPSLPPITPLMAPTQRPDEPVTAGSDMGPGPGTEAVQLPARTFNVTQTFNRLAQNDPTGEIELILKDLNSRGIE